MTSQARALLDALMGPNRNEIKSHPYNLSNRSTDFWEDPSHCSSWLLDLCPHELLMNTRVDLGRCPRRHEMLARERLKKETGYPEISTCLNRKLADSVDRVIRECEQTLATQTARCDRLIARQKERLVAARDARKREISDLLQKAEKLAEIGDVSGAMASMNMAREISDRREDSVCEVCGAIVGNIRTDPHISGRQHRAFTEIRRWRRPLLPEPSRMRTDSMVSSISQ